MPAGSALLALLIGAVVLIALGANPIKAYAGLIHGALGGRDAISATVTQAVPLMLVAAGISIAFRAHVLNIGGEGQMIMGGLLSAAVALHLTGLPRVASLPIVLVAGAVGGGAFAAIAGALKAYFNVNEVLSTIMLNLVAVQVMNYLLTGPLIDPTQNNVLSNIPQTARLPRPTDLPVLVHHTSLNAGLIVALLAAGAAYVLLWRTAMGFRLRAVGLNPDAARYAGIPVRKNIVVALALSGVFCGLAGAVLVFGGESHRLVTDGTSTGFTGNAGFNGIIAALFGALQPLWAIPASVLFGALLVGSNQLQRDVQVPTAFITALNGLVVIFVVSSERLRRRMLRIGPGVRAGLLSDLAATETETAE